MLADEFEVIIQNSDARRWRRIMRNCWIAVASSFIVAAASCCAFGQIKIEQTTVAPYQLWVGFVAPEIQADGTVKASVDSKPVSKTVQPDPRLLLILDEGYSLKDLEVETVPGLEFVQPTLTQLDGNRIELKIDATGKFRARAELDYGGKKVVSRFNFTIGTAPKPPPKPDDPPVPPPDTDVRNEYGVGLPAYTNAPDAAASKVIAKVYRSAGDSLYAQNGQPLRSIDSDNPSDKANPNRNVIAWINQQTASAKPELRTALSKAFSESQAKRQYSKADWYAAFNEIADALEKVK